MITKIVIAVLVVIALLFGFLFYRSRTAGDTTFNSPDGEQKRKWFADNAVLNSLSDRFAPKLDLATLHDRSVHASDKTIIIPAGGDVTIVVPAANKKSRKLQVESSVGGAATLRYTDTQRDDHGNEIVQTWPAKTPSDDHGIVITEQGGTLRLQCPPAGLECRLKLK